MKWKKRLEFEGRLWLFVLTTYKANMRSESKNTSHITNMYRLIVIQAVFQKS